jgi:hypothetical protein
MLRDTQQRPRSYPNVRRIPATVQLLIPTKNLANLKNQEQWMGLCELASNEHDQEKLGALFEGILRLMEDHLQAFTSTSTAVNVWSVARIQEEFGWTRSSLRKCIRPLASQECNLGVVACLP